MDDPYYWPEWQAHLLAQSDLRDAMKALSIGASDEEAVLALIVGGRITWDVFDRTFRRGPGQRHATYNGIAYPPSATGYVLQYFGDWMRARGFDQVEADRFAVRWADLQPGEAWLCPQCFIDEVPQAREQRLEPLSVVDPHYEPMRCPCCHVTYFVPKRGAGAHQLRMTSSPRSRRAPALAPTE